MEEFGLIMKYAKGNPGAMMFLIELFKPENMCNTIPIAIKLEEIPTLKGTNLYVLYSDLCNKDMGLVMKLCKNCPNDILENACSRQDYSGRELVAQYLQ
jgi:hypothetical protein